VDVVVLDPFFAVREQQTQPDASRQAWFDAGGTADGLILRRTLPLSEGEEMSDGARDAMIHELQRQRQLDRTLDDPELIGVQLDPVRMVMHNVPMRVVSQWNMDQGIDDEDADFSSVTLAVGSATAEFAVSVPSASFPEPQEMVPQVGAIEHHGGDFPAQWNRMPSSPFQVERDSRPQTVPDGVPDHMIESLDRECPRGHGVVNHRRSYRHYKVDVPSLQGDEVEENVICIDVATYPTVPPMDPVDGIPYGLTTNQIMVTSFIV